GEQHEPEIDTAKAAGLDIVEEFFDAMDEGKTTGDAAAPPVQPSMQQRGKGKTTGVDPSRHLPDFDLIHLQAEFARALQANSRFQELLQQVKPNPPTSRNP
ncbi:hypothetical protein Dimus_013311, partial [Dionaea muscipula]